MCRNSLARALCIAGLALSSVWLGSCIRLAPTGPFACADDGDCNAGERCVASYSGMLECRAHCDSNADCAFPDGCVRGACEAPSLPCQLSNVCTSYVCNAAGFCNRSCRSSADCSTDYTCRNRVCEFAPSSGFGGAGGFSGFGGASGFAGFGGFGGASGVGGSGGSSSLLSNGQACAFNSQCSSTCCDLLGDSVCAEKIACSNLGNLCNTSAQCPEAFCCAQADSPDPICQATACTVGELGDACSDSGNSPYCASGFCEAGVCALAPGSVGAPCAEHRDCQSTQCCVDGETGDRSCELACPTLIGDYCLVDDDCPDGAFCQGPSNFAEDGFCSADCALGCGYNSRGVANRCITLTSGSIPGALCKPACETNGECWEIHDELSCWETPTEYACDFDTDTWASAFE